MRRASVVGPLLLVLVGGWFLISSLRPDLPLLDVAARYWPLLLIAWGCLRLVEILVWAARSRPLPQAGHSGGEWTMIVLICLIGSGLYLANRYRPWHRLGVVSSKRVEVFGRTYDFTVAEQQKPAGKAPRILLENLRGNVRITGADVEQVRVSGRKTVRALEAGDAERADQQSPLEVSSQGGQIVLRTNQDRVTGEQRVSADLDITVPRGASLEARAREGEFEISELAGNLEISSDRAQVRLRNLGGNARVDVRRSSLIRALDVKGALEISGGQGEEVELENIGGTVTLTGSFYGPLKFRNVAKALRFQSDRTDLRIEQLPGQLHTDLSVMTGSKLVGPIRLSTNSRDVRLEEFTGTLELELDRGDISLRPAQPALARIGARTRRGRIELALPVTAKFQLRATTSQGDVTNDFGPALQADSAGRGATLRSTAEQGPEIVLSTERGSITVRKDTGAPLESAPQPPRRLEAETGAGRVRVEKY
jgi:DUF4097 and DUF4098 domain-containing protein YvlB